ncbi:putative protein serine/threonine kinase [Cavenderia fasciculata]|uniref:Protein kinase domain-containing protein n=1 Tax=Cavenderia fasciculata TaxID=261658 RepID=F4PHC2_CACFS|nr:putative protein serine/threonine kinase [Cavenderia fasciculata]EGG25106.1 putative protein serine/threonine kinase [Cavenderia fasciculata]|eukprot:XP_004362957.1 putative protein serine/threonine kinase [Cavenderia fasciculata]
MDTNDPFSKYQIGEVVGKGAFGKVYKALNIETGDFCAIKQIEKSIISEKQLPSILQEIKLLQTLRHNNIVRFIESHETSKYLFFALEFVEGGTLGKMVKRYGNFQEPLLCRYVCQVLGGLAYLHEKGVIHRDIKSDNILITKDGVIKLADFGSCTYSALDRKLTVVGTPFWMAPEVIQMDMNARSTACDIWSLGCTILELLTGNPPYWDLGTMPAMFAMVNNPHPPIPANISAELKSFLLACFMRDINKRPTANQLLEHPWIKNQQAQDQDHPIKHQRGGSKLSVSTHAEGYQDEAVEEDENDLKERIAILELQKKEQAQTIQKLKYHFVKALKEKKAMKEMIAQLVQERDGYMIKLGLNPPPPPPILLQTQLTPGSTPTRAALENANEVINATGGSQHKTHHLRTGSQSSPLLKSSGSFRAGNSSGSHSAGDSLNNGGGHGSSSSSSSSRASMANILNNEFFQPPDSYSDEEDTPSSPMGSHEYLMNAPTLSDLHIMGPPKVTKRPDQQMGGYLSSGSNLQVYSKESTVADVYSKSPHQYSVGGGLTVNASNQNLEQQQQVNNSNSNRKPPMLQKESSQKGLLNQYISSPSRERRDSIGSSGKTTLDGSGMLISGGSSGGSSIGSSNLLSTSHGSIGSTGYSAMSSKKSNTVLPTISINHQQELEKEEQHVPPVEQVVVNVQPPRVGDTCKVKCGELGWYDAIVELVSGTTFVVTIKPFNIKQEVSHSDVTLAPLQLPDNTKKKGKFNLFKK